MISMHAFFQNLNTLLCEDLNMRQFDAEFQVQKGQTKGKITLELKKVH